MASDLVLLSARTISNDQIIAALEQAEGILVDAARELGMKRYELEDRLNADPHLNRVHLSIVEGMIDVAQRNVFTAVKAGNYNASVFMLTTLGKEKGYSTKAELSLKTTGKSFDDMDEGEILKFLESSGFKLELGDDGVNRITAMPA